MSALLVFLDGVGLGPAEPGRNPFAALDLPAFARLAGGQRWTAALDPIARPDLVVRPLDATLGVEGLPQSGTGQAALFGGFNAPALAGRHFGPYPPSSVRPTLAERSVFARLVRAGHAPGRLAFANAYPDRFFRYVEARGRWTGTTFIAHEAGVRLRRHADLAAGEALAADLTAQGWPERLGPAVPTTTEAEAGRRLARLARAHAFTLFEFFLTDKAGHAQDPARAAAVLGALDRFLAALLDALDPARDLVVVSSDHGNLEDLSVKTHTRHPVPLVAWGAGAGAFARAETLADVAPALVGAVRRPS